MPRDRGKVLVVGSGGREHALAWKLRQSPLVRELFIAPGNAGTAQVGRNVDVAAEDIDGLIRFAISERIDLTVVGPEIPLIDGIVDRFREAGLSVFGPTKAAARIEGSKAWAKDLMQRHGIPTSAARRFEDANTAIEYLESLPEASYVLKADGPAAGKGVILPESRAEAESAVRGMLDEGVFGESGSTVLIEDRMSGPEVSVFAFIDGTKVSEEIAACDYKRAYDGDAGPNTGGVGAYSPPELWTAELAATVRIEILERAATAMVDEGCPYSGMLYAGLMLTPDGPKVVEFNCRFGDPETQVILPLFDGDLAATCLSVSEGNMESAEFNWVPTCTTGVVVTSSGYPGKYETGAPIRGLDEAEASAIVFHAGTRPGNGAPVTSGGRVVICVGQGDDMATARTKAYEAVQKIEFDGAFYRTDIASRAVDST